MDFVFICTVFDDKNDDSFDTYFSPSVSGMNSRCIHVTDKKDKDEIKCVSSKYNVGIAIAIEQKMITSETVVIFAKSNVNITDKLALEKFEATFNHNHNVSVVGVAGCKQLTKGEALYSPLNKPVNGIIHHTDGSMGKHIQYSPNGFYDDVVAVDDSMFAIRGSFLMDTNFVFAEDCNNGFGIDVAIASVQLGYDVVVADILVSCKDNTTVSFNEIKKHVDRLSIKTFPIVYHNIPKNISSVVEIEL